MADKAAHRPTLTSTIDELSRIHQDVTDYAKQAEALRDLLHAAEEQHRLAAHAFAAERRQLVADLKAKELEVSLVSCDFNMEPLHSGSTRAQVNTLKQELEAEKMHTHTRVRALELQLSTAHAAKPLSPAVDRKPIEAASPVSPAPVTTSPLLRKNSPGAGVRQSPRHLGVVHVTPPKPITRPRSFADASRSEQPDCVCGRRPRRSRLRHTLRCTDRIRRPSRLTLRRRAPTQ
jgi:hypothetical protein